MSDDRLNRPILITGTPRAGKSVVASIVAKSSAVHHTCEPLMLWDYGKPSTNDDCRDVSEATDSVISQIRRNCASHVARPDLRYLDDLAYHALRLPFVHRVMPNARIVNVIRSGTDILPDMVYGWCGKDSVTKAIRRRRGSMKYRTLPSHLWRFFKNYVHSRRRGRRATWGPRVPGLVDFSREHKVVEVAAYQWSKIVSISRRDAKQLPAESVLEVRFDVLCRDPTSELGRIATFCEIPDIDTVLEYGLSFIKPDRVHSGSVPLSDRDWELVRPIIAPLQEELGYSVWSTP